MLPFTEQGKRSLILLGTRCAAARSLQQQPWRTVSFDTRPTLPAPLDFSCLEEQVFLTRGSSAAFLPCGAELLLA